MKNTIFTLLFCWIGVTFHAQKQFKVVFLNNDYNTHYLADENNAIIKQLDSTYLLAYQADVLAYFHVFAINGQKGWTAIDWNGNILFQVYNVEIGTLSPDDLTEGLIRIEKDDLIGFANEMGEIIIQPQFEIATAFANGYAIIGATCKNVPWDENHTEQGCMHYSTVCEQHGYIDRKGNILALGYFTYEEITEMIKTISKSGN